MYTIIETPIFTKMVDEILSEEERNEPSVYIAQNPDAGDIVQESGGCRKVRWNIPGSGKSKGVRIIYYNELENGYINLLIIYKKSETENIPAHILHKLQKKMKESKHGKK